MSTGTTATMPQGHAFSGFPLPSVPQEMLAASSAALAKTAAQLVFSDLAPRLRDALDNLNAPGSSLLEKLADNINSMQERFMEHFQELLASQELHSACKLTLRLNDAAELCVSSEHPHKESIDRLLRHCPELSAMFVEIAAQSSALRDLKSLYMTLRYGSAKDSWLAKLGEPGENAYQLSLKGEMSHFYFTR